MQYTYNLNGSVAAASNDTFAKIQYHPHSLLPTYFGVGTDRWPLQHDSEGRRLVKISAKRYLYRRGVGGGIIPLAEKADGEENIYIQTPSGHRLSRSSTVYYIQSLDHLGSVRMRIGAADCVSAMYSAYGESIMTNDTKPLRYTFTGYELDSETNLLNAWRRIYSPKLARFVMVDPKLQNASPYLYCSGDPFNNTDPTGEISSAVISGIIAALVMILTIVIVVVSEGTACPEALEADVQLGTLEANSQLAADINAADTATTGDATFLKSAMPTTRLGMAGAGAAMSGAGSLVSNGAGLVTNAAKGEHISAWQGIKAMLIEPAIATVTGFIGGGIAGFGALAFKGAFVALSAYALGAAVASISTTLLTDAAERQKVDGAELGLQVGVAVGEALLLSLVFTPIHPRAMVKHPQLSERIVYGNERAYVERTDTVRNHVHRKGVSDSVIHREGDINVGVTPKFRQKAQVIRWKARFKAPRARLPQAQQRENQAAFTMDNTIGQTQASPLSDDAGV